MRRPRAFLCAGCASASRTDGFVVRVKQAMAPLVLVGVPDLPRHAAIEFEVSELDLLVWSG